jgi:hypothetical protein
MASAAKSDEAAVVIVISILTSGRHPDSSVTATL